MIKWVGSVLICLLFGTAVYANDYEGQIVQEIQISCITSEAEGKYIRQYIPISPGEPFSQEKTRTSIRQLYAQKTFSQILVEAEFVAWQQQVQLGQFVFVVVIGAAGYIQPVHHFFALFPCTSPADTEPCGLVPLV